MSSARLSAVIYEDVSMQPTWIVAGGRLFVGGSTSPWLWLSNLVFSNEVLHEIVFTVASVVAIGDVACPVLQLSVAFVFVSNPIGLTLERLGLLTIGKGAGKGLNIFVYMLGPVRRLVKLLYLKAQRAFKLSWETFDRW